MNTREIIEITLSNGFLEAIFGNGGDWDAALDLRDNGEFDNLWTDTYSKLRDENSSETEDIRTFRETVFKKVLSLTGHSDLAAYASDDLGLIAEAAGAGHFSPFVESLWNSYLKGNFPCGR